MSTLDVVAEVLREVAPRALKAREITALARDRLPTASRTPETVVSRDLALDVKHNGAASRFLRVDRGAFVLKEALPSAFYNDNDSYAAAWTRNLIAAGEIAAGVVDERSIRDLKPADVASYRQCHFFSGIGVWSRALRDAGFPDDVNVWSGSCPCQNFSSAGKREGFAGDLHLWPEWFRLIAACRPAVVIGEQTASALGRAWLDLVFADLEGAGYSCQAFDLPACCVGAPHRRQRLYFVAYARERGREILGASWLHDRGQSRDDTARRCEAHGGDAGAVSDAAIARPRAAEDAGADRRDACTGSEARERWASGCLESERGGHADDPGAVSDAERVVRDAGRIDRPHGRPEVEPDRHGEAHGGIFGDEAGPDGMGDAGSSRGGRDAGEVSRAQEAGEGERIEARYLADEPRAPGAADGAPDGRSIDEVEVVRGAAGVAGDGFSAAGFRPGDRIRLSDPTWGGAVGGFWAEDVEWIYCRPEPGHQDGCWRPARAGIEPLVAGAAPELGQTRAKRLRGFGNAIVLPLATEFVAAVIDAFADAIGVPADVAKDVVTAAEVSVEESAA